MMRFIFKTSMMLLLAAVITAPLAAQSLPSGLNPDQRPAGCHQHTTPVPEPGPTSHYCCQAEHHPAIVQQTPTVRPEHRGTTQLVFMPDSAATAKLANSPNVVIVCSDPPIVSPLRV
jgi:hypothetical protein